MTLTKYLVWAFIFSTSFLLNGNVVKLEMNEHIAQPIPVHPAVTISIKFPYPIDGLEGVGFTSDLNKNTGEYLIAYTPNKNYFSIFPLEAVPAPRNLNVIIKDKIYVLKPYIVADLHEAWNVIIFEDLEAKKLKEAESIPRVTKSYTRPSKAIKTSSSAKIIGLIDTTKLITQVDEKLLPSLMKTMPNICVSLRKNEYFDYGTHRIFLDIVSRNDDQDVLVFGTRVINDSKYKLFLNPESFTARVGNHVYTQVISDFKGELEPGESSIGYFAIIGTSEGAPNYLSANNKFLLSLSLDTNDAHEKIAKK